MGFSHKSPGFYKRDWLPLSRFGIKSTARNYGRKSFGKGISSSFNCQEKMDMENPKTGTGKEINKKLRIYCTWKLRIPQFKEVANWAAER
jgi:hypothetical protein